MYKPVYNKHIKGLHEGKDQIFHELFFDQVAEAKDSVLDEIFSESTW